ncbi:hypothetical protein LWI28_007337 [Acer negundo]|uniref:Hydroxyethylthiazole kinase n=1 Tax=Acer negundo TaxID=4023 RepID=A0AAD5JCQ2_ACENE|nr:hypothetical protein LWI28_007337 [Acer negundo]KAK4855439.1 hypothetical protein QYF36_007342 [Acer negundo]
METNKEEQLEWGPTVWSHLTALRDRSPLIQCITNFVSMDLVANTLLSAGASPAMIHSLQEFSDFTPHIHALYVNVGTLSPDWLSSMKAAALLANELRKPWVLDPVAAGSSQFRLNACLELLLLKPTVIRGNASEIIALSQAGIDMGPTKGVDSSHESMDAVEAAKFLAEKSGSIVAVSGAVDIICSSKSIIHGDRLVFVHNGVPMLQKITATGCAVTALIAAFVAAAADPLHAFDATVSALSVFGIAGEMGMELAKGPASLRMHLIDSLYGLDQPALLSHINITG